MDTSNYTNLQEDLPWLDSVYNPWTPTSKYFKASLIPVYRDDYDADICWHGCDKVSRLLDFGGGGGS